MALALALAACGSNGSGRPDAGPGTASESHADDGHADDGHDDHSATLREMLGAGAGPVRFRAVVVAAEAARWSSGRSGEGIVYAPVRVRVEAVYRGRLAVGETVRIRRYGGVVDGTDFDNSERIAAEEFAAGRVLIVYADPAVRTPDGVTAMAPTDVFAVEAGTVRLAPSVDQLGTPATNERVPLAEAERIARGGTPSP